MDCRCFQWYKSNISKKAIRIIRKGFKTKKEALEAEQHIRVVELKETVSTRNIN